MKQKYKKENSPRMQSAINRTFNTWQGGWRIRSDVRGLGMWCLALAYGADKYDVLNALCPGVQRKVITFARGDIRHRKSVLELFAMLLTIVIALAILSLRLAVPC